MEIFEKAAISAIVLTIILILGLLGFLVYGHLTQHETITVEVVSKLWYVSTTQSCVTVKTTICTPITRVVHRVVTPAEAFGTSQALYEQVKIGKKHTFYVTGWPGNRDIAQVLE